VLSVSHCHTNLHGTCLAHILPPQEDKAGQAGPPAAPVSTQEAATAPAAVTQPASAQQPAADPAAAAAPAAQADVGPSPDQVGEGSCHIQHTTLDHKHCIVVD
jgi:hypothetical protein